MVVFVGIKIILSSIHFLGLKHFITKKYTHIIKIYIFRSGEKSHWLRSFLIIPKPTEPKGWWSMVKLIFICIA